MSISSIRSKIRDFETMALNDARMTNPANEHMKQILSIFEDISRELNDIDDRLIDLEQE